MHAALPPVRPTEDTPRTFRAGWELTLEECCGFTLAADSEFSLKRRPQPPHSSQFREPCVVHPLASGCPTSRGPGPYAPCHRDSGNLCRRECPQAKHLLIRRNAGADRPVWSSDKVPVVIREEEVEMSVQTGSKTITSQTFDEEVLKSASPVLVDFWADCRGRTRSRTRSSCRPSTT